MKGCAPNKRRFEIQTPLALEWNSPASTDTFTLRRAALSYSILLEFLRAHVTKSGVQPPAIVESLQVLEDRHPGRVSRMPVLVMDQLALVSVATKLSARELS